MEYIYFILVVAIIIAIWFIKTYNKLQEFRNTISEQSSNIIVAMQKRRDLAQRIMDVAQGVADHEKLTHFKVSENQKQDTSSAAFVSMANAFPELKANESYQKLMGQLNDLEDNIADKRMSYNKIVKEYNSYVTSFPTLLVAGKLKFEKAPFYNDDDEETLKELAKFGSRDSEALQDVFKSTASSISKGASIIKDTATDGYNTVKNSEKVKDAVAKGSDAVKKGASSIKDTATDGYNTVKNSDALKKVTGEVQDENSVEDAVVETVVEKAEKPAVKKTTTTKKKVPAKKNPVDKNTEK